MCRWLKRLQYLLNLCMWLDEAIVFAHPQMAGQFVSLAHEQGTVLFRKSCAYTNDGTYEWFLLRILEWLNQFRPSQLKQSIFGQSQMIKVEEHDCIINISSAPVTIWISSEFITPDSFRELSQRRSNVEKARSRQIVLSSRTGIQYRVIEFQRSRESWSCMNLLSLGPVAQSVWADAAGASEARRGRAIARPLWGFDTWSH